MVLEYLPGGTLEERLRDDRPLPDGDTMRIAAELAAGLAHAHARDVVHRDLKPANVLFDKEGRAKLADFGIARMAAGEGTLTEAGTVLGTAAYISPEQAAGSRATAASDVYSFGVMLYRMLTGRLPFESNNPMELVALHRDTEPPPLTKFRDDVPPLLESATTAAISKDPANRPQTARLLAARRARRRSVGGLRRDDGAHRRDARAPGRGGRPSRSVAPQTADPRGCRPARAAPRGRRARLRSDAAGIRLDARRHRAVHPVDGPHAHTHRADDSCGNHDSALHTDTTDDSAAAADGSGSDDSPSSHDGAAAAADHRAAGHHHRAADDDGSAGHHGGHDDRAVGPRLTAGRSASARSSVQAPSS